MGENRAIPLYCDTFDLSYGRCLLLMSGELVVS
jgi:hypothetical protein